MLKSMTGFGRSETQNGDFSCKAEIRAVNNRFIDINARLPKALSGLEHPLKKLVKSRCARGSFDINLSLERTSGDLEDFEIKPNLALATQYYQAFSEIKDRLKLKGEIDINSVLTLRDIVKAEPIDLDSSREDLVLEAVDHALSALIRMREEEGQNLQSDILSHLDTIQNQGERIKSRQPEVIQRYKERLREKIQLLTDGMNLDEARMAQETAIMADRCDVTEEVIRLESHLQQFRQLIESDEPQGRKLEFLTQEINRETNTIGSKTIDQQISRSVIEMKSALEKIREQLQNIE